MKLHVSQKALTDEWLSCKRRVVPRHQFQTHCRPSEDSVKSAVLNT